MREEDWSTKFNRRGRSRFPEEETEAYKASIKEGALRLELKRSNLFAWVSAPQHGYRDFFIEAELSLSESNGHSAAGLLLRQLDDSTFYYFLMTNRGSFRFDIVSNGTPRAIINWTDCLALTGRKTVRIIARGTNFSFYVEDRWLGEVEDDGIDAGRIAFAAQNYEEQNRAVAGLHSLRINSLPYEVEIQHYRWSKYLPVEPDSRERLANSFISGGQYGAAILQLRKSMRDRKPGGEGLYLLAECENRLGMREEALGHCKAALELLPGDGRLISQKANLLYSTNRFVELRDHLQTNINEVGDDPVMWNLLGNAWYALGDWKEAGTSYQRACEIDTQVPLFLSNAARAQERLDNPRVAVELYLEAANLYFQEDENDELASVLSRLEELDPGNREVRAIEAKILFQNNKFIEAEHLFKSLIEEGYEDASVHFLFGLILSSSGRREEAENSLERATDIEPDYYLYWLRSAENSYLLRGDPGQALGKALETGPAEPWVNNLAGQIAMEQGEVSKALGYLQKAFEAAPDERDIRLNYTDAVFRCGEREKALGMLSKMAGDPDAQNLRGNLLSSVGKMEDAVAAYERATGLAPENPVFAENCAAACLELDMVHRAEELLARVVESSPRARAYNLLGHAAGAKGEHERAAAAYREALKQEPEDNQLALNLVFAELDKRNYEEAGRILQTRLLADTSERAEKARRRLRKATQDYFTCASCTREWWVPREIPPQPRMIVHGRPPGDSPAGSCPECGSVYCVECASKNLREERFICPNCDVSLRLSNDSLKYLVAAYIDREQSN